MASTKFNGMTISLAGDFVEKGNKAPDFHLTKSDLGGFYLSDAKGKNVVLNIFPSLDTSVCAASVRKFNKMATELPNTMVLCISKDLPFAHQRFCAAEGIQNVLTLSDFRYPDFGENYGVLMADGPLYGLLARAVVVVDPEGKIIYTELVPEIGMEPNYEAVLKALK